MNSLTIPIKCLLEMNDKIFSRDDATAQRKSLTKSIRSWVSIVARSAVARKSDLDLALRRGFERAFGPPPG
jgi:hypothetical protein